MLVASEISTQIPVGNTAPCAVASQSHLALCCKALKNPKGSTEPSGLQCGFQVPRRNARKALEWPAMCHRPGAFLAGRMSLFLELKVLRPKERDPLGTVMNVVLQQCQLSSAAWLMTQEKTGGKSSRRTNPYWLPVLDKIRHLILQRRLQRAPKTPSRAWASGQTCAGSAWVSARESWGHSHVPY